MSLSFVRLLWLAVAPLILLSSFHFTLNNVNIESFATSSPRINLCRCVRYPLEVSASNKIVTGDPARAIASFEDYVSFALQDSGTTTVQGNYVLAGHYCQAALKHSKYRSPLLLLVHGNSYSSTYWSAFREPSVIAGLSYENYSWPDFAAHRGFHVLSIDRLGGGQSDTPDPLRVTQKNFQAAVRVVSF